MSEKNKNFTKWYVHELSKGSLPTKIFQKVINNDLLFKIFNLSDEASRKNRRIFEYEKKEWRLMTIQQLAQNLDDCFSIDLSNNPVLEIKDVVIAYPATDPYVDIIKSVEGFKKLFPLAKFNLYDSSEHMPRGNFLDDSYVMGEMNKIIKALEE
jgi:hypothetical protein